MPDSPKRPTKVRYLIVTAAMVMAFLLYLDRFCVSFAVDFIRQDLGLSQNQMGMFLSAFFWSYALAQVPSGWLSDRYGAAGIMLVIYILSWSLFTALIGASTSFAMLLSTRFLCGLGQSGAYPTAAPVVGRWVPIGARGTASAFVAIGGRLGGALAPVLTAYLIVMMVPADTPVRLKAADILQPKEIAERLLDDGGDKPQVAVRSIRLLLTEPELEQFRQPLPKAGDVATILNRLIQAPDIYDRDAMRSVSLPKEAVKTLKQLQNSERIEAPQQQRFNRFVLEGVFSTEIAKFYGRGWRPILYIYGAAGIIVAVFFWLAFRERPDVHPWCNKEESDLVLEGREGDAKHHDQKLEAAPILPLLKSGNMWCCCIMQWGTNVGWLFLYTWLPRYLMDVHQVPILERGYMTMTPALVGLVGTLLGGRVTDFLARRLGVKWGRRVPIAASRVTALLAYVGCVAVSGLSPEHAFNSPWFFTGLFAVVAFSTDFGTASTWAFNQDIGGRQIGSVLGWGNMWGNLGAAVAPLIYTAFLGETPGLSEWNAMFWVCAASFGVSAVCAMLLDASKPLVAEGK